jgi:hypothetical protein
MDESDKSREKKAMQTSARGSKPAKTCGALWDLVASSPDSKVKPPAGQKATETYSYRRHRGVCA